MKPKLKQVKLRNNRPAITVVGLGNPGNRYLESRHNLGFMTVDRLADLAGCLFQPGDGPYDFCQIQHHDRIILLVKPMTFMNRSGIAVDDVSKRYRLKPEQILVVCDDLSLPLGKLRVRKQGSAGGHNGLSSIGLYLHNTRFPRMKLGIDSKEKMETVEFVLSPFTKREKNKVELMIRYACEAVFCMVEHGIERTMNQYN